MQKLLAVLALFRQGNVVANAAAWKNRQITVTALGAFLLALIHVLKAFGVEIPVDEETANTIAAGVLCLVNIVLTLVTTDKIGLPSKANNPELQTTTDLGSKQGGVERIHEPETTEVSVQSEPIGQKQPCTKPSEYKSIYDFDHYRN